MWHDQLGLDSAVNTATADLGLTLFTMRRLAILTLLLTALSVIGSLGYIRAFSDAGHPFATTWCDNPIVVQLVNENVDGTVTAAEGVSFARGGEAAIGARGPAIRLNDLGSRAQVNLGQTLFHTQWLISGVSPGDGIRVDALIGSAGQPVEAYSVRGALAPAENQTSVGLVATAVDGPVGTGEIDVFSGATQFLFTNEANTPIEVIAAIGCPALELNTEQVSAPVWDPEAQRFIAEYSVSIHNQLANSRVRALRVTDRNVANTVIEDVSIDLDIAALGFSSAEILDVVGSGTLGSRLNPEFDGRSDTALLANPLRLADSSVQEFTFAVAYEPNFDDPAWDEGIDAPAPEVSVRGVVDSVQVGLSGVLRAAGADLDRSVSPSILETPSPGIVLELDETAEPWLASDGRVELSHELVITNNGETLVDGLTIDYPLVEMFGPGTVVESITANGANGCAIPASEQFDGDASSTLLFDQDGLDVGERCTVSIESRIIAGLQPEANGTLYDAPLTVTANSGARIVRDVSSMRARIAQDAALDIEIGDVGVTNTEDGRYTVDGTITLTNTGELDLGGATIALDIARPAAIVEEADLDDEGVAEGDDESGRSVGEQQTESAPVFFFDFVGDTRCSGAGAPNGASASAFVSGGIALQPNQSCEVDFSFVAIPGSSIDDWTLTARTATPLTAVQPELAEFGLASFDYPEAPSIETAVEVESITNNANGTYSVRTTATIANTGDTPLTSVFVDDDASSAFGTQLLTHEVVGDSCSGISGRFPLPSAAISEANTCSVTTLSLIEPGTDLDGDVIEYRATATSTSTVEVDDEIETDVISFTEAPRLTTSLTIESVERLDPQTIAFVLAGTIENTGDVNARNVQAELNLSEAFDFDDDVAYEMQFSSVQGLNGAEIYTGAGSNTDLLTGTETIVAGSQVGFRVLVHATPGDNPGPYEFTVEPSATSPARANFVAPANSAATDVPIIGISSSSLDAENNNDGTYDVTHSVTAVNGGVEDLTTIGVFTTFDETFGSMAIGEIELVSTCATTVAAGEECEVTQTATVRPGSAVGPHEVAVSTSSTSDAGVAALVLPETTSASTAGTPLLFPEEAEIEVDTAVGVFENNGDGTYGLTYEAEVSNRGDVPLYRVGVEDFTSSTYGDNLVSDQVLTDSCSLVSFENPLLPGQTCERSHDVVVRPLDTLGPWNADLRANADSPSFTRLEETLRFDSVTFTEDVSIATTTGLAPGANNGDGTFTPEVEIEVTNTGDVPIIELAAADVGAAYGDALLNTSVLVDSCTIVSFAEPLLPGATCSIEQTHLIAPGSNLGPFELEAAVTGRSASGASAGDEATTNAVTLRENPVIDLASGTESVENIGDGTFRVVKTLTVTNGGDVRIDDLALTLNLAEVFPDIPFRLEGAFSNEFFIAEEFTAGESINLLAPEQSLPVDGSGTITLVVSVEPGSDVGPFAGELRAAGNSPADAAVSSVVTMQLDLPSVAVAVLAQSVDNNRDGSYTVTTSYEIVNDGTTSLEFVRLTEDLNAIYEGTRVSVLSIDGDGLSPADLEDEQRSGNLVEWGATLASGDSATMTSSVVVEPGNILGPFIPAIAAQATSPAGTIVADEASSVETIEFVEQPALRVEQQLAARPVWTGSRFEVTFAIEVINDGDVELRGLQVREDLLNALGAESRIVVSDIRSDTLVVNRNFDGLGQYPSSDGEAGSGRDIGDTRLLGGGDTLAAGTSALIELDLVITPETRGVYSPRVIVSARTPSGADLGSDEEIEANTLTRLSVQGELGVAKQTVGDPILLGDGSIAVTYEILVENAGPFPLDNVAVHDQLSQAFGVGSTFETSPVRIEPGSPCAGFASTSYDGGTINPVLANGFELQSGEQCRIQYDAVVDPAIALPGPYRSSAFAIATDPFSGTVIDDSTDGTNTDPDGNQEPGDNDIATPVVVVVPEPALDLTVETLPSGELDAAGRFELGYLITVVNSGGIDVQASRVVADLDESWDVDFDVLSVTSTDVTTNGDFNGSGETNLLDRRTLIPTGESVTIELRVRAVEPDSGDLDLDVEVQGLSINGSPITSRLGEPIAAEGPDGVSRITLLDTMSTREQQLLGLGSAVILLFIALFVRSMVRKANNYRDRRTEAPIAELTAAPTPLDELYIDLRPGENDRRQLVEAIDLTEKLTRDAENRHRNEHHKARRRRGRRPRRQVDS